MNRKYAMLQKICMIKAYFLQKQEIKKLQSFILPLAENLHILYFDHSAGGGTEFFTKDYFAQHTQKNILYVQYMPKNFYYKIQDVKTGKSICIYTFQQLAETIKNINFEQIIVNNLVGYPDIKAVFSFVQENKKSSIVLVNIHDYFMLCPKYVLLNQKNVFCHIPKDSVCESCLQDYIKKHKTIDDKHILYSSLSAWQMLWNDFLTQAADKIFVSTKSSYNLLAESYPAIKNKLVIRGLEVFPLRKVAVEPHHGLNIAIIGTVSSAEKGKYVIEALAREIKKQNDIKIVIIGKYKHAPKNLTVYGSYKREDLPAIIEEYKIDAVLFPSVWPETFSYVCSEVISMGLPLACFDIGAQAEKVKSYEKGILLTSHEASSILNEMKMKY